MTRHQHYLYREKAAINRVRTFLYSVLVLASIYQAGNMSGRLSDDPVNRILVASFPAALEDLKAICEEEYCDHAR